MIGAGGGNESEGDLPLCSICGKGVPAEQMAREGRDGCVIKHKLCRGVGRSVATEIGKLPPHEKKQVQEWKEANPASFKASLACAAEKAADGTRL
jgi:hypothetical protein